MRICRITLLALTALFVAGECFGAQSKEKPENGAGRARDFIVKGEYSAAADCLRELIEKRDPAALMLQGVLHAAGAGVYSDHPLAVNLWTEAAFAGHRDAARLLIPWVNNQYAREWWQDYITHMPAPEVGPPQNMVSPDRGGLVVDPERAKKWIAREAASGNPVGLYNAYHAGKFGAHGNEAAKKRVRGLLESAAEKKLPIAMRELSSELEQSFPFPMPFSMGFVKDIARARELMRQAAELGDAHAQLLWAHWLNSSKRGPKDSTSAVEFYDRSSKQGNPYAAYFLFEAYSAGEGVGQDADKAGEYLRLAALRGDDLAVNLYANRLFRGLKMEADPVTAIAMLERSLVCSLVPNDDALALVAFAYASGTGVEKNSKKAMWWAKWAVERGSDSGKEILEKLTLNKN